jgi:hypothetical protein
MYGDYHLELRDRVSGAAASVASTLDGVELALGEMGDRRILRMSWREALRLLGGLSIAALHQAFVARAARRGRA